MREICINEIAKSWLTIANALPEDNVIQCLVLDNIASYVDWIELDLVANDYVMPLIISKFQNPATSEVDQFFFPNFCPILMISVSYCSSLQPT